MASGSGSLRRFTVSTLAVGIMLLAGIRVLAEDKKVEPSSVKPVPRKDKGWGERHHRFLARAKKGDVDVLFLGDSITHDWEGKGKEVWKERLEPFKAANFGIGGDRTQHVLWRITEGKELEGVHPKVVVLMIGTNNLGDNKAEDIAEGITSIVQELRHQLPHGKVLLLGIFPRSPKPADAVRDKIKDVNTRIAKLDDGKQVVYLDIGAKFLDAEGNLTKEIMPDYLHLSAKGYKIWADAIQMTLDDLLKKE